MTLDELRDKIKQGEFTLAGSLLTVDTGVLKSDRSSGKSSEYQITHGWDVLSAQSCDQEWGAYRLSLMEWVRGQKYNEKEQARVLSQMYFEDNHWDWLGKSVNYHSDEYEWFFMFADQKPQGACLIYHPKESLVDFQNIFYIEFIAVAPWNRETPMEGRKYKGVGTKLITCASKFATSKLGLVDGFSLHSLPQAESYYCHLGMISFPVMDKGRMKYFEMPREEFRKKW